MRRFPDESANLFEGYSRAAIFRDNFPSRESETHIGTIEISLDGVHRRGYLEGTIAILRYSRITREDADANQERCLDETPRGTH
jgi:hypothetical protein